MPITVTMQKATEESGLSLRTIQYAIARGDLKSVLVGKRRLIPVRSLEAFLLRGGRRATQNPVPNKRTDGEV